MSKEERMKKRSAKKQKNQDVKHRRRDAKKQARVAIKKNYIACIAVCFIMVFIAGEYSSTTSAISTYDNAHVADLKFTAQQKEEIVLDMIDKDMTAEETSAEWGIDNVDAVTKWKTTYEQYGLEGLNSKEVTFFGTTSDTSNFQSVMNVFDVVQSAKDKVSFSVDDKAQRAANAAVSYFDSITKKNTYKFQFVSTIAKFFSKPSTWQAVINILNFAFSLLLSIFVTNVLMVGERRFFLENHTYKKTKIGRFGFLYRERTLHPAKTMFIKDIFQSLWWLTIVGGVIKTYSYAMVPFICAENPNIKTKECIRLSREMMNGHKWEYFKVHFSMIGWTILSAVTLGFAGCLFTNPYKTAVETEMYLKFRRLAIENGIQYSDRMNDKYLDLDLLQKQMEDEAVANGENPDIAIFKTAFTFDIPEDENDVFKKGENKKIINQDNKDTEKKGGDEE